MNMPLLKLYKILVCCHLFNKILGLQSLQFAVLFLNLVLSSHYYLAVRSQSQIQYTFLSFQIDSPLQLNTDNIKPLLFNYYLPVQTHHNFE